MDQRNNNNYSPFYDLPKSGNTTKKTSAHGELQIFSDGLKRTTQTTKSTSPAKTTKPTYTVRPKKRKSKSRYKTHENRSVTLTVVMIYAAVGFFVGSLMIARYSNIIKKDDELDAIEAKIEVMQAKAEKLQLEVSLQDDIGMVQEQAKGRLGLYYPSNDQIVYVELDDEVESAASSELMQGETEEAAVE